MRYGPEKYGQTRFISSCSNVAALWTLCRSEDIYGLLIHRWSARRGSLRVHVFLHLLGERHNFSLVFPLFRGEIVIKEAEEVRKSATMKV
jgi:hypothetical protein